MSGLTHDQTKRFLQADTDKCLNPTDRLAVEAHLAQCAACQAYAQELTRLDQVLRRGLRTHWSAPYRSPVDVAARVRRQLRTNAERRLFLGVANVLGKLSSLAVGTALVLTLFNGPQVAAPTNELDWSPNAAGLVSGLSRFEVQDMNSERLAALPDVLNDPNHSLPINRLRAAPY